MQNRLKAIRERLSKIRPGKWSKYGISALINYGKKYCGMWDRDERPDGKTHAMPLYDEDADFIANAPADIQFLLDALERAWEENKQWEEANDGLIKTVNILADSEQVLREALTKVNNLAWDVLSTLENERGVVEGQLEYDYLKDIETVIEKALKQEDKP